MSPSATDATKVSVGANLVPGQHLDSKQYLNILKTLPKIDTAKVAADHYDGFTTLLSKVKNNAGSLLQDIYSRDPSFIIKLSAKFFESSVTQCATQCEKDGVTALLPAFLRGVGTVLDIGKLKATLAPPKEGETPASFEAKAVDIFHVFGDFAALTGYIMQYNSPGAVSGGLIAVGYLSDLLSIAFHGRDYFMSKNEIQGKAPGSVT